MTAAFAQYDQKGDWDNKDRDDVYKGDGKGPNAGFDKYDRNDNREWRTTLRPGKGYADRPDQPQLWFQDPLRSKQVLYELAWKKRQIKQPEYQRDCDIKEVMDKFWQQTKPLLLN